MLAENGSYTTTRAVPRTVVRFRNFTSPVRLLNQPHSIASWSALFDNVQAIIFHAYPTARVVSYYP